MANIILFMDMRKLFANRLEEHSFLVRRWEQKNFLELPFVIFFCRRFAVFLSLSACACLDIASCKEVGIFTSLISTALTCTPQVSAIASMEFFIFSLRELLSESITLKSVLPTTSLRVVFARLSKALAKFST